MVQVLCKIWGVGMLSILALTTSNILLTLRLLRSSEDSSNQCSSGFSSFPRTRWTDSNNTHYLEFLRNSRIVVGYNKDNNNNKNNNIINKNSNSNNVENNGNSNINVRESNSIVDKNGDNARDSGNRDGVNKEGDEGSDLRDGRTYFGIKGGNPFVIDPRLGRFDDRRLFKTFDKVLTGPDYLNLVEQFPVCLATQSSVDRLYWLTQVSKYWEDAPISVALFTPDVEYSIARAYLQYLITCFPHLGKKVTIHFTFPRKYPPKEMNIVLDDLLTLCNKPLIVLKSLLKKRPPEMLKWRETLQYPQNLLRNVARKNCGTEWVFLTDVDIIPIPNLAQDLGTFLQTKEAIECKKCAFVIPTYEVSEKASFPYNRTLLLNLASSGKARPFHQKVFVYNQHATNFTRWAARESLYPREKKVTVSHKVTSFEFFYEPFYVARDDVPHHDERFLGYGFTRNTQVYEMFVADYSFQVLAPIFTLHWGMQVKKGRPSWRERQNNANRKLFEGFKKEVFARYQRDPLGMMKDKQSKKKKG